jgi:hypothetical protein
MQPNDIFANVRDAYRDVTSYQDSGAVFTRLRHDEEPSELRFQTWFARPLNFRFDWRDHHPYPPLRHIVTNYSIRATGEIASAWQDDPHHEEANSLSMAIAGATGISQGAAYEIPNLLMPEIVAGHGFERLGGLAYEGAEQREGVLCHVVSGHDRHQGATRLWIGVDDWFVRTMWNSFPNDLTSEQIHRDIVVNGLIPPNVFTAGGSLLDPG